MLFLRTYQHLLPRAKAWRVTTAKVLRQYLEGLAGAPEDARAFIDGVFGDVFPSTTRELAAWEKQFGILPNADEATRRLNLAAEWSATGGQSPSYIQGVLHTAGFTDVYIHEWWSSGPPYVARDPRDYTTTPTLGSTRCGLARSVCARDGEVCDAFLANQPGYLVNLDLTRRAPPAITDDPDYWPHFIYFAGETFPDVAEVDADRRAEFERLILKLCPNEKWIVTLVDYV
jgi:hypothetical protein